MNYIDELIKKHCPDGVSYKPFGQLATIVRGASPRPIKNFITLDSSGINWIKIGDVKPGIKYITETAEKITIDGAKKSRYVHAGDFILSNSMSFGRPYILKINGCIHDGWLAISDFQKTFLPDFLYHLLNSNTYQSTMRQKASFGGAVQNLNADIIRDLEMPLVPLEVQREIVRILDSFTSLTAELSAELSARQKQYEYYRDLLLSFKNIDNITDRQSIIKLLLYVNGFAWVTLNDISQNCDNLRKPITSGKRESGAYPYYGASGIVDYVKDFIFDGDYLLISEDGANLLTRNTPIAFSISGRNWVNNHAHVLKFDTYELRRYVEFYLNSIDLSSYISGGAQPKLNQKNLNRIPIPMPAPSECKRIVSILDRFDTLCNDLSAGLPAEIAARQQQYEYYRDKLLTFKELT